MATCSRCQGEGEESYEEDGRIFTDVCYHCGGEGKVDEETDFHDRLMSVASTLAYQAESEYRKACDSDPDGDGYDLCAAENGLMSFDYFRCRVWERTPEFGEKLLAMSREDQEFLIAWNEMEPEPMPKREPAASPAPIHEPQPSVIEDDNIPF